MAVAMLPTVQFVACAAVVRDAAAKGLALALHVAVVDGVGVAAPDGFAGDVGPEPLGCVVVKEALGVGKAHGDVAGVTGVLEHGLQGKGGGLRRPVVRGVLDEWRIEAIDCNQRFF